MQQQQQSYAQQQNTTTAPPAHNPNFIMQSNMPNAFSSSTPLQPSLQPSQQSPSVRSSPQPPQTNFTNANTTHGTNATNTFNAAPTHATTNSVAQAYMQPMNTTAPPPLPPVATMPMPVTMPPTVTTPAHAQPVDQLLQAYMSKSKS